MKVLVTGDTHLGGGRVANLAASNEIKHLFGGLLQKIKKADLAITNLESPILDKGNVIDKIGPALKSPENTLAVLKEAGFNLLTLANNHIMDYGFEGLSKTLEKCSKLNLQTVGAGQNNEVAREPFLFNDKNVRLGILNVSENEFSIAEKNKPGAYGLDPIEIYSNVKKLTEKVDHVLLIVHGGNEYYNLPSPRIKDLYRYFIEIGVSAVIAHHPHCFSGYEVYKGAPIFYSLGNFLFDKQNQKISSWNFGYAVELNVSADQISFELFPYRQGAKNPGIELLDKEEESSFSQQISLLNETIAKDEDLENEFTLFCEKKRKLYEGYLEPYSSRILLGLKHKKLFPSFLSRRRKNLLLNLARCESHRDVIKYILQNNDRYSS